MTPPTRTAMVVLVAGLLVVGGVAATGSTDPSVTGTVTLSVTPRISIPALEFVPNDTRVSSPGCALDGRIDGSLVASGDGNFTAVNVSDGASGPRCSVAGRVTENRTRMTVYLDTLPTTDFNITVPVMNEGRTTTTRNLSVNGTGADGFTINGSPISGDEFNDGVEIRTVTKSSTTTSSAGFVFDITEPDAALSLGIDLIRLEVTAEDSGGAVPDGPVRITITIE